MERLDIPDDAPVAYITQTTLSVDDTCATIEAVKKRFKDVIGPETRDICYATQNRQTAVRELATLVDVILVVGARNSSNSNRLREIGEDRHPELPRRRRPRRQRGMVRRQDHRRPDGRRLGAGSSGRRRHFHTEAASVT